MLCSSSGHHKANWTQVVDGKSTCRTRWLSKAVYITHALGGGPIPIDPNSSTGRSLVVDHLDQDPSNNNIANLRLLTSRVRDLHTYAS